MGLVGPWDEEGEGLLGGSWGRRSPGVAGQPPRAGGAAGPSTHPHVLAGVSAQSFLHCFTLASAAFNLQVATPGVSPAPFLSGVGVGGESAVAGKRGEPRL